MLRGGKNAQDFTPKSDFDPNFAFLKEKHTAVRLYLSIDSPQPYVDLTKPIDISLPLSNGPGGVNCFHAPEFKAEPYVSGDFVGSVKAGAPVNFFNVSLNPHGNGTHTECMGHISAEMYSINACLTRFHFMARLWSVLPEVLPNGDQVVTAASLAAVDRFNPVEALVLRTLPNDQGKRRRRYSGTNPPYFEPEAMEMIVQWGVRHLLVDLPSVDREEDGGALAAHKAFWQYPGGKRLDCTITELIYVPDEIEDGLYFLNLQIASFELDASPSKPILYRVGTSK